MKLLIIPDAHSHVGYDNDRFSWLGEFIADEMPDHVVCLGDGFDFPSLNRHAPSSQKLGRKVLAELAHGRDAFERVRAPISKKLRRSRRKGPRWTYLRGNHDEYLDRIVEDRPELEGLISADSLPLAGWDVIPYRETTKIGGVAFSHNFPAGVQGAPIGGVNIARSMILKGFMSSVCGHVHTYSYAEETRWDGSKLFGLCAGCYVHPGYREGWNRNTFPMWWRGVVVIDDLTDGFGDVRKVSQDSLKRRYS